MKNILLLTDFSENARVASKTALLLSQKLHTDLILMNAYLIYPTSADYVAGQWYLDAFKEREDAKRLQLEKLEQELQELCLRTIAPGDRRPMIRSDVEDIGLNLGIQSLLEKNHIELIVMGVHEEEMFGGNHVNDVVSHIKCPVLVMTPAADLEKAREIIYATDYSIQDIDAIAYLAKIAKAFGLEIKVVHVAETGIKEADEKDKIVFENHLKKIHNGHVSYRVVRGDDVVKRLIRLVKAEQVGILATLHEHHSFFGRLITHSDTKELLNAKKTPLLIFPAEE